MNTSKAFDLSRLRLRDLQSRSPSLPRTKPPRHGRGERFLKGPVPWNWLARAASLPGRALHMGNVLWYWAGITRTRVVAISLSRVAREFGVSRTALARGLAALERAELVSVERHAGRKPTVTLHDARPHQDIAAPSTDFTASAELSTTS